MVKKSQISRYWQKAMIFLATHGGIKHRVQTNGMVKGLAHGFVGGDSGAAAVQKARQLKQSRVSSSFFFLGEYIKDETMVEAAISELKGVITLAGQSGLDLHTSIDPTQAGLMQSRALCTQNLETLALIIKKKSRPGFRDVLMMDMEDAGVTQVTLDIFQLLCKKGLPMAITLQACLKRTPNDLAMAVDHGVMIRLVKGAFAENKKIAHALGRPTDQAFLKLAHTLLSPKSISNGTFPVFATHDHKLIAKIIRMSEANKIPAREFEFEMLFGVRPKLQKELADKGFRVRVYLPFGRDFWPYTIRRIGENPKNIKFLIRSLIPPHLA